MLLLYHNFIALNENPIFAGMNPFNFACQNPLSEQLSHSTVQCSSTWVDMRVWVLRGESGTPMKSARSALVVSSCWKVIIGLFWLANIKLKWVLFQVDFCGVLFENAFPWKYILAYLTLDHLMWCEKHITAVHFKENPHECEICQKRFSRKNIFIGLFWLANIKLKWLLFQVDFCGVLFENVFPWKSLLANLATLMWLLFQVDRYDVLFTSHQMSVKI